MAPKRKLKIEYMEPDKFGWQAARTREDRSGPLRGIWPTILTIKGLGTQSLGGCRPPDPPPYLGCLPPVGGGRLQSPPHFAGSGGVEGGWMEGGAPPDFMYMRTAPGS